MEQVSHMPTSHNPNRRTASPLSRVWLLALLVLACGLFVPLAQAQRPMDLGFTYSQERTKFVGSSTNDFFRLRGATVDFGYTVHRGLGVAVAGTGLSVSNLRQSIDIHQASFMAGPRFTYNYGHITPTAWNRHTGTFVEGLVGYTFATSGLFPISGNNLTNHASGLTYQLGGGINLGFYHRFDLRILQVDYVQTHLPNGGTNQQNNIRLSAGVNFHFGN
jgi:hypothetical protein